jgi:hypothetical protein
LNASTLVVYSVAMSSLHSSIQSLAEQFASGVLHAIRSSSLEEILGEAVSARRGPGRPPTTRGLVTTRGPGRPAGKRGPGRPPGPSGSGRPPGPTKGRLRRRSEKDLAHVAESIVALVGKHKGGLRGEQIRAELGIPKNAWMKPLSLALGSKKLTKKGQKRATVYFARA